jgi:PTH2 family peptidyl-tRNA hydrolase
VGIKQVIVIRRDLKMRRGKEIAQGAHASMMFLSKLVREYLQKSLLVPSEIILNDAQAEWIRGLFAKICLQVPDEAALLAIAESAQKAGLDCHIVTDSGLTEFNGVPTRTCLAIGPDESSKIDAVTGHLSLY